MMRENGEIYDPDVLESFAKLRGVSETQDVVVEIPIRFVKSGMTFAEDVMTKTGVLFVSRGYEVTESFVERAKNLQKGAIREPVRAIVHNVKDKEKVTNKADTQM